MPCTKTWVEIVLVDQDNAPVPGAKYRIKLPDSSTREGSLDANGKARVDGILAGTCQVSFPDIHAPEWQGV